MNKKERQETIDEIMNHIDNLNSNMLYLLERVARNLDVYGSDKEEKSVILNMYFVHKKGYFQFKQEGFDNNKLVGRGDWSHYKKCERCGKLTKTYISFPSGNICESNYCSNCGTKFMEEGD